MRKVILCCILSLLFAFPLSNRASAQKINDIVIEGTADFAKGEEIRLVIFDDLLTYTPKTVATAKISKAGKYSLRYKTSQITLTQLVIRTSKAEFFLVPARSYHFDISMDEQLFQLLDPEYYAQVDLRNPVRLQRALEVCYMTGRPYSQVVADRQPVKRPFDIEVRVTQIPAADLRTRIDRRVDQMMTDGLLDEVRSLLPHRHLSTLRTVGYRELFPVLDGTKNLADAVAEIKLNTWHYARKQMTWCRRYI